MERVAVIKITPDEACKSSIQTGGVSNLEILDILETVTGHFARELIREYSEITGDQNPNPNKIEQYINFLRKNKL